MSYSRFFAILNRIPGMPNREGIIEQYTCGRTDSLREMTRSEYDRMCNDLEAKFKDPRTAARSTALKLMQRLGVDTTDWNRINAFCRDRRIAGKEFYNLTTHELGSLATKLRGIQRNGGLNPRVQAQQQTAVPTVMFVPLAGGLPN